MENLLQTIVDEGAAIAIIDITGVPTVDTLTAQQSSVPITGRASTPSHSLTTGVDSSAISRCWRRITSSRLFNSARLLMKY